MNTRFEVECHEVVAVFELNEWLKSQFSAFQNGQIYRPDKRQKLDNKAEGQVFVQKTEFQRQKWKVDVYKSYVQEVHMRIAELEASLNQSVAEITLLKSHTDELLHALEASKNAVRVQGEAKKRARRQTSGLFPARQFLDARKAMGAAVNDDGAWCAGVKRWTCKENNWDDFNSCDVEEELYDVA